MEVLWYTLVPAKRGTQTITHAGTPMCQRTVQESVGVVYDGETLTRYMWVRQGEGNVKENLNTRAFRGNLVRQSLPKPKKKESLTEYHKSVLFDHIAKCTIHWDKVSLPTKERNGGGSGRQSIEQGHACSKFCGRGCHHLVKIGLKRTI